MSKTKRSGQAARIGTLEKDLRRLRAQLRGEIHHAVRTELGLELARHEAGWDSYVMGRINPALMHALGRDEYSEREA